MIESLERRQLLASALAGTISIAPPDCGCGQQVKTPTTTKTGTKISTVVTTPKGPSTTTSLGKGGALSTRTSDGSPVNPPYNIANRWTTVASGNAGSFGGGITLTWSVMPDGTSIPGGEGEAAAPSDFVAKMNALYGGPMANWLPILSTMFNEWGAISGITYLYESHDDGAALSDDDSGVLGVRGDIRIGSHPIDGANADTLAYTYFPNNGDMVVDSNELGAGGYLQDTSSNSLKLRNVLSHEAGHGFGLDHVCPVNDTKLMEPFVTTDFDGPQFDDTLAVNRLYGDLYEKGSGDNNAANAVNRGTLTNSDSISNVSISTTSDTDYYKFTLGSAATLGVTLSPVGPTYLSGTQNDDGTCSAGTSFNAMAQSNLQVQLIASNGTTVLNTANANGVGSGESLSNISLSSGTYYLKISDASGSPNLAQMYSLSYSASAASLTATITPVAPDPRTTSVDSIVITFTEPVNGFDLGDLTLQRDPETISLSPTATLTTSDNQTWTLGNLSTLTTRVGGYTLRFTASTGITGISDGQALSNQPSDFWAMEGLSGTSGDDVVRIVRETSDSLAPVDLYINSASVTYVYYPEKVPQLVVSLGSGDDTFIADYTNGTPFSTFPTGQGATFDGGTHNTNGDTLKVVGESVNDSFNVSSSAVTHTNTTSESVAYSNTETLDFTLGTYTAAGDVGASHSVTVNGSTVAQFNATQHLNNLTINNGGLANVGLNGSRVVVVKALSLVGSGTLDLFDNDMIIDYDTTSPLSAVTDAIRNARAGNWSGSGLTSSAARGAAQHNTTLGDEEALDWKNLAAFNTTFDGEAIDNTAVLIKYTYYGDANLNGKIDGGDYSRIDSSFNKEHTFGNVSGWLNGDFDGNGKVDGGDYALIDSAFNSQSGVL